MKVHTQSASPVHQLHLCHPLARALHSPEQHHSLPAACVCVAGSSAEVASVRKVQRALLCEYGGCPSSASALSLYSPHRLLRAHGGCFVRGQTHLLPPSANAMASPSTLLPVPLGPTIAHRLPALDSPSTDTSCRKHLNPRTRRLSSATLGI